MESQAIAKMATARHFRSTGGAQPRHGEGPFGVRRLAAAVSGTGASGATTSPSRSPTRTRLDGTTRGETGSWEIDYGAPFPVHGRCAPVIREDVPRGTFPRAGKDLRENSAASRRSSERCSTWNVPGGWRRSDGESGGEPPH